MVIYMINIKYLQELVKVPKYTPSKDDYTLTMFGECTYYFHMVCPFEYGKQIAPCINCPYEDELEMEEQ